MTKTNGKLVVISGPSGVGKTTLVKEVLRRTGADYSVSLTTRQPRAGEVDGRDYHFVYEEKFKEIAATGGTAEHAFVHGHWYGTPLDPIRTSLAAGRTMVLDIDVQGGLQVHQKYPDATFILIVPPGRAELERRLRGRASEDAASLTRRLAAAEKEISTARASGVYNHEVVNDRLESAVEKVVEIIQSEEGE